MASALNFGAASRQKPLAREITKAGYSVDRMNHKIHHLAVWVLVVIHFFVGLGWYALLGNTWLNLHARSATDIELPHNIGPYILAVVAAILVNYALAWLFAKLHVAHAVTGLKTALICWFAFLFVPYAAISAFSAFETNPWPLVFVDMGRPCIAFAISGIVLGAWRRREP
jgi:Protein of unknown function (DUF1761)